MSYTEITAHIVDQTLQLVNLPDLASGGVGNILVKFDFCSLWDGYGKTAVFYRNPADVHHIAIVDNVAKVPHEVMPDKGYFFLGVMGVADNVRTTEVIRVNYKQGAITTATATHKEPTPDIYQQLLAAFGKTQQDIAVERARIDNLAKLREGSTTGDAELMDMRVGADGTTYASAGAAMREQIKKVSGAVFILVTGQGELNGTDYATLLKDWKASKQIVLYRYEKDAAGNNTGIRYYCCMGTDKRDGRDCLVFHYSAGQEHETIFVASDDSVTIESGEAARPARILEGRTPTDKDEGDYIGQLCVCIMGGVYAEPEAYLYIYKGMYAYDDASAPVHCWEKVGGNSGGVEVFDNEITTFSTWSSAKIAEELEARAPIILQNSTPTKRTSGDYEGQLCVCIMGDEWSIPTAELYIYAGSRAFDDTSPLEHCWEKVGGGGSGDIPSMEEIVQAVLEALPNGDEVSY